jgi:hypothetical protein
MLPVGLKATAWINVGLRIDRTRWPVATFHVSRAEG